MRHGDTKTEFETGATRDDTEGKGRPSLISPVLIHRTGEHLRKGEEHYPNVDGEANWSKGMPFRRTADSLIRHIFQWLAGDEEEDHLAAISCNTMFLMHFEEAIANGNLPASLDDRDTGFKKILPSILTSLKKDPKIVMMSKKEVKDHCGVCRVELETPIKEGYKWCESCAGAILDSQDH